MKGGAMKKRLTGNLTRTIDVPEQGERWLVECQLLFPGNPKDQDVSLSEYALNPLRIHRTEVAVFDDKYRGCLWIKVQRPCAWQQVQRPAIFVVGLYVCLNVPQ